jgi:hypothetical protein
VDNLHIVEIDATVRPDLADQWGVLSIPTTFIIDASGQRRQVKTTTGRNFRPPPEGHKRKPHRATFYPNPQMMQVSAGETEAQRTLK